MAFGHWTTWGHHHSGDRVVVALCELVFQKPLEDLFPPCRIICSLGSASGQGLSEVLFRPSRIIGSLGLCINQLAQHHNSVLYPQPHCFKPPRHTTRTLSLSGPCPTPRPRANMPLQSSHFALENSGKGQSCVPKRAKSAPRR